MLVKRLAAYTHLSSNVSHTFFCTFWSPLGTPLGQSRYMSHGWKEDSMLVKRLAAYTHLSSTISEIASYWSKIATFSYFTSLAAPQGVTPSEFREDLDKHTTRINGLGLSCGEDSLTIG